MTDPIIQTITPVAHDLGAFEVRRAIPSRQRTMVGPFIFVDQFGPAHLPAGTAMDVRPHPHINLATVTWLFDGSIYHRDSLGSSQPISPGELNWMTAGKGIVHSERTAAQDLGWQRKVFGIQSWVALPKQHEETAPAFDHVAAHDLPVIDENEIAAVPSQPDDAVTRHSTTASRRVCRNCSHAPRSSSRPTGSRSSASRMRSSEVFGSVRSPASCPPPTPGPPRTSRRSSPACSSGSPRTGAASWPSTRPCSSPE